jgi:hypothetical protein
MSKRPNTTPSEQLREKLYKVTISENINKTKPIFNSREFVRKAKEVRKTFKDEYILPSDATY